MKDSEIYRHAAEIVGEPPEEVKHRTGYSGSHYSCLAISIACEELGLGYIAGESYEPAYAALFKPDTELYAWGVLWGQEDDDYDPAQAADCRILALCFMAAIAEDEALDVGC